MPINIYENILTQYDCSTVYLTSILTVFKTEFKQDKKKKTIDVNVQCCVNFAINHNQNQILSVLVTVFCVTFYPITEGKSTQIFTNSR